MFIMEEESVTEYESPPWPRSLLVALTLLGVFKGNPIQANRRCLLCRRKREDIECIFKGDEDSPESDKDIDAHDNQSAEDSEADGVSRLSGRCAVCLSLLWNADGAIVSAYSKAVPRYLNSRLCGILSSLCIIICLGLSLAIIYLYIYNFWGSIENLTHLVSFMTYVVVLAGVSLVCTVFNTMQWTPVKDGSWWEVFHLDYAARRLRCLAGRRFPLPEAMFLSFSIVWVFANNSMQAVNLAQYMTRPDNSTPRVIVDETMNEPIPVEIFKILKTIMDFVISVVGLPLFASFWFYVLVMRRALAAEFNLVLVFIRRNQGNLVWCRRRIAEIDREFGLLRDVLAVLMPFIMASAVLGLTVHITWNYEVYSEAKMNIARENLLINIFIFSEKLMLLIIPLFAVGSVSIDYIWSQFMYALSRQRNFDNEKFWDQLLSYASEIKTQRKGHHIMLFLAVISLYLGRNITDQKLDYRDKGRVL